MNLFKLGNRLINLDLIIEIDLDNGMLARPDGKILHITNLEDRVRLAERLKKLISE